MEKRICHDFDFFSELEENNAELNAQMLNQRLEDGRNLLNNMNCVVSSSGGNSLAAEFEAMSNEEVGLNFNFKIGIFLPF